MFTISEQTVVIDLEHDHNKKLMVEVADLQGAVRLVYNTISSEKV
jgi:hypothetical protein